MVDGLGPEHRLSQEETFGSFLVTILTVQPTSRRVVQIANGVRYGLVTSVHGRDLERVLATAAELDTGPIKINAPIRLDFCTPCGGETGSSFGPREQGQDALAFYMSVRTVAMAPHDG